GDRPEVELEAIRHRAVRDRRVAHRRACDPSLARVDEIAPDDAPRAVGADHGARANRPGRGLEPDAVLVPPRAGDPDSLAHLDPACTRSAEQERVELAPADDPAAAGLRDLDRPSAGLDARAVDPHVRDVEPEPEVAEEVDRPRDEPAGAGLVAREFRAVEDQRPLRELGREAREPEGRRAAPRAAADDDDVTSLHASGPTPRASSDGARVDVRPHPIDDLVRRRAR